jgi:uncharacterized protein YkwD
MYITLMRVRTILSALLLGALLTTIWSSSALAALPSKPNATERALVAQINKARAARDLPPLRLEGRLTRVSRWMSKDMAVNSRFSHTDSLGRNPFRRLDHFGYSNRSWRGENIAAGNREAGATYRQWWNSRPHRLNMLNRNYRYIGISRYCLEGSVYTCYWTTEFGGHWTQGFAP